MDTGIYAFYKLVYCIRHGGSNDILELDQVLWLLAKQSAEGYLLTPECCFAWKNIGSSSRGCRPGGTCGSTWVNNQ